VLPTAQAIAEAQAHTDPADLVLDAEARTVYLRDPNMRLDVGAVAKGYAVERVAEMLEAEGIDGYLINAGGNVRAVGGKQTDAPWQVDVSAPDGVSALGRVTMMGGALVTSGSYQRFLVVDGKTYSHIIDPTTGIPAARYVGVTISLAQSDLADLLSTALFVLSEEDGRRVAAAYGAEVLWVYADGSATATDGFAWRQNT
jgi:thiamine biosynthesis lipoprotein